MNLLPDFRYHRPESLDEAVRLKATLPGSRFLAGGTDLLVNLRRGLGEPSDLIDLTAVADLSGIRREGEALVAGRRSDAGPARPRIPKSLPHIRRWPRRRWRWPARLTARRRRLAATCARTPAASSITRANGGARAMAGA